MMSSPDELDEQLLTRYLLGELSEEEAERVDEWRVTDDEFAWRLDAVENDLVDAYVRGGLSGEILNRFRKVYLSSPKRLEKVEFSRTLLRFDKERASGLALQGAPVSGELDRISAGRVRAHWFAIPPRVLQWASAAAALLMLLVSGYLFVENERLRKQGTEVRKQVAVLDQHGQELERELRDQRSANTGMLKELERLRASLPASGALKTVTVLLLPQTRGVDQIATVSMSPRTERVTLQLQLESDDFPVYRVALKDLATNAIIWHSHELESTPEGGTKAVSVTLPASILRRQRYGLDLVGLSANNAPEFITSYLFTLAVK